MQKQYHAPVPRPCGATGTDAQNFMSDLLTDLLNRNAAAYTFFYSLSPQTQEQLRTREIYTLQELHRAAADIDMQQRPQAF